MAPNVQFTHDDKLFDNPEKCRRLVGKLNYLRVTRPDITFAIMLLVRDKLITIGYMKNEDQLKNLSTKALTGIRMNYLCSKLDIINIYDTT
ncbi:hypothetical protein LIER_24362 [Lithospermum erythrorhizon]|uniref:Reverse transcriptase n=1 Tax=Lithospermum erythrorhizon TaxID=34254 RepID=A0AAV3R4I9_LITER